MTGPKVRYVVLAQWDDDHVDQLPSDGGAYATHEEAVEVAVEVQVLGAVRCRILSLLSEPPDVNLFWPRELC